MKKLLFVVIVLFLVNISASALFMPNVYGYDKTVNYMQEMIDAATDGSSYALAMGELYETQRNNKIRTMGLDYKETDFFSHGKSGKEILALIEAYRKPPELEPEPEPEPEPTMTYLGRYYITGYDTCARCCGKSDGVTASGTYATVGRTIATGTEFSFGTRLYIDGIGYRTVEDRGVGNGQIDVLCSNHTECYALTGWYDVYRVEG